MPMPTSAIPIRAFGETVFDGKGACCARNRMGAVAAAPAAVLRKSRRERRVVMTTSLAGAVDEHDESRSHNLIADLHHVASQTATGAEQSTVCFGHDAGRLWNRV